MYVFLPLFETTFQNTYVDLESSIFVVNYFYFMIDNCSYKLLISLYLLAPLITLYFKEHGSINEEFVSNYDKNTQTSNTWLDIDKDEYDAKNLNSRMNNILANKRTLSTDYYLVKKYTKWVIIVGEKRRKSSVYIRNKILIIVSLLIVGMPMSLSSPTSLYYMSSLSIFIFIMLLILTQILYSGRSILKLKLIDEATHAAYRYYEKNKKSEEPFTKDTH